MVIENTVLSAIDTEGVYQRRVKAYGNAYGCSQCLALHTVATSQLSLCYYYYYLVFYPKACLQIVKAVSYTHLDVYKRQVQTYTA